MRSRTSRDHLKTEKSKRNKKTARTSLCVWLLPKPSKFCLAMSWRFFFVKWPNVKCLHSTFGITKHVILRWPMANFYSFCNTQRKSLPVWMTRDTFRLPKKAVFCFSILFSPFCARVKLKVHMNGFWLLWCIMLFKHLANNSDEWKWFLLKGSINVHCVVKA